MRYLVFLMSVISLTFINVEGARAQQSVSENVGKPKSMQSKEGAITIKVGSILPEGSTWSKLFNELTDEISEKTGNGIRFKIYRGGALGDEAEMVRKMMDGHIHMGAFSFHGISTLAPEMSVLTLPCIFNSMEEADYIRETMYGTFARFFEEHGTILLAWIEAGGFAQLFSKNPIRSPSDLADQNIWVWSGGRIDLEIIKTFKEVKTIIPLPLYEVKEALNNGVVDVVYNFPLGAVVLQWYPEINYITKLDFAYSPGVLVIEKGYWDNLPQEWKIVIKDTFKKYSNRFNRMARKNNDIAFLGMLKRGIKLIYLTPKERDEFVSSVKGVWGRLANDMYPGWLLDEVLNNLEDFR